MTFGNVSLNGTVHVIPSLLEEATSVATDPPSVTLEPNDSGALNT